MSRIGNKVIIIPAGVEVEVGETNEIKVKGPKGEQTRKFNEAIGFEIEGGQITVTRPNEEKFTKMIHGTSRALLNNMIVGVSEGYTKELEITGVGYRAAKQGTKLVLSAGFSHPVEFETPVGLTIDVPTQTQVVISGINKQAVGEFAANVRKVRPPEPYKGKGIRYKGEHIRRKEGKKAK